jgi:hypothetical protein
VNFVLGCILMGFERYLMPFMAFRASGLLTVQLLLSLSTKVFPSSLILPERLTAFGDAFLRFHGFPLHFVRLSGFLSKRKERHHERKQERNQNQLLHTETPFGWSAVTKRYCSSPSLRSAVGGAEVCGFQDRTSVRSCGALGREQSSSTCHLKVSRELPQILRYDGKHFAAQENPMLEPESVRLKFPEDTNIIVGQTHFIKTAEDMYGRW